MVFRILRDVASSIYKNIGNAFLLAFFFMFFYQQVRKRGLRETLFEWAHHFFTNRAFGKMFLTIFYTFMVLSKTVLNRSVRYDPLSKVFEGLRLFDENGNIVRDAFENSMLLIPFSFLLLCFLYDGLTIWFSMKKTMLAIGISFLLTVGIETAQIITQLGTFQISDILFNTLGGVIGAVIYSITHILIRIIRGDHAGAHHMGADPIKKV